MNNYVKIIGCMLFTTILLKAEISRTIFDIKVFKDSLKEYPTTLAPRIKLNCEEMLNKLSEDIPSSLQSTYQAIKSLTLNAFNTADVLYKKAKSQNTELVVKSINALVKEQASAKRSFFGTKLIQGAKNLFAKKDTKDEYNDLKKLFNDIFDALSAMIKKMQEDSKKFKGALVKKAMNEIYPF